MAAVVLLLSGGRVQAQTVDCQYPRCDWCYFGSIYQMNCPPTWIDDGECDCACQFADNADCGSSCSCPSACVWCWCNTTAQGACPSSWYNDGECDCACQFADVDCPGVTPTGACCYPNGSCNMTTSASCSGGGGTYRGDNVTCAQANCAGATTGACCGPQDECAMLTAQGCASAFGAYQGDGVTCEQANCPGRCDPICDYCWTDTPVEGGCDQEWEGDGLCDCGCQFVDPDCGPRGACCLPLDGNCAPLTEETCRFYAGGLFHGVDVLCGAVDCDRCGPGCLWCWIDTVAEHRCDPAWESDEECDCGCQFADPDCAKGVCGNLVCEESGTSCNADCKDLREIAAFQNCFAPGQGTPEACYPYIYTSPAGIDLLDYASFISFWAGP